MSKIYLINVGANTSHRDNARSPLFPDGSFKFVTFPDDQWKTPYPLPVQGFVRYPDKLTTHLDPDWEHLTYGDVCDNPRARALLSVRHGDILLFWALLWKLQDSEHDIFLVLNDTRKWCLVGALRVTTILQSGESIMRLAEKDRNRVRHNAHVYDGHVEKRKGARVFIGDLIHSALFDKAVDLQIYQRDSLLLRTVFDSNSKPLQWTGSPKWYSVTRSCRAILDLANQQERQRAEMLRIAIQQQNPAFDLFKGA